MASISKDKNGTKRVQFYGADKKQVCIHLGNVPMKVAQTVKVHVEKLLAAQTMKTSVCPETARWLTEIPDELHQKFVRKGFVPPRKVVGTLGEMIPNIIKDKSVDAKPTTIAVWGQAEESLYRYFGKDRQVNKITEVEAKEFNVWLAKKGRLKDSGSLKPSTVYKRIQHVIAFFHILVEEGAVTKNPFAKLAKKPAVDDARNKYVDEETILKIMEYAPSAEWRLIIALWRFAGLRAASEVLMLKWEDVLWDQKVIMVSSPKTEHHRGKAVRKIPFFPHIEECLTAAFEQAEEGAVYVVEKHAPLYLRGKKERTYIAGQGNLGTMFKKIMRRAGIAPWKKLLHNLRASFETDLLNGKYGKFGLHTIATWLGHSVKVMLEHYGRIQQSDYDQIEAACLEVKKAAKKTASNSNTAPPKKDVFAAVYRTSIASEETASNTALYTAVEGGIEWNGAETPSSTNETQLLETTALSGKKRQDGASSENAPNYQTGWRGIRTPGTLPYADFQDRSLRPLGQPSFPPF